MRRDKWTIFHDIFSRLSPVDYPKLVPNIVVSNSENVEIRDNEFTTNIFVDGVLQAPPSENSAPILIPFLETMSADKFERARLNIEYLDRFIFECNRQGICPVFRCYGLFSHLSTLRSKSDYSEYNQLVLEEKKAFDEMLALNYRIKLIISLDVPIIVTRWGYSIEETKARIANLCDNIDLATKDHNIEVVIDEKNSMDSLFICDNTLLIKAMTIDPIKKYSITKYVTNQFEIANCTREFDQKFSYCKLINNSTRKMLHIESLSSLIISIIDKRIEEYYKLLNER